MENASCETLREIRTWKYGILICHQVTDWLVETWIEIHGRL